MGRGFKNGGGGMPLNFKVVGNPKPDAPRENTIWIDTDTPINGYTLSADAPAEPVEGMVWIFTGGVSTAPFAATKKNPIVVEPSAAYQYTGGAWVQKTAQTYLDGAWQEWKIYLFNDGQVNEAVTGGIYGTIQDGKIHFSSSVGKADNKTYTAYQQVDLTGINSIKCVFTSTNTSEYAYFRLVVTNAKKNGDNVTTDYLPVYRTIKGSFAGRRIEATLDVSNRSGPQWIGYSWGVLSDGSTQTITGDIERWWLE